MKAKFKPLGLAAAVAAVSAGYAGTASATVASNSLGDLALVPYYTVQDDWTTGIHITNTTDYTQVVKFRMRRGSDSADALDFNIIMSPKDVWVANINDDEDGNIILTTTDNSCTAPLLEGGTVTMPSTYRVGAEEGYIEVIGMAQIGASVIASAAKHTSAGVPLDCASVRTNFLQTSVTSNSVTQQTGILTSALTGTNTYMDTTDGLKVSYFIRDAASGIEFGNSAVHIQGFQIAPTMTHQQYGLTSFALLGPNALDGFDWPDLNGGGLNTLVAQAQGRDRYDLIIRDDLGYDSVLNDWSYNSANGVSTDWVVTIPGQYTMINWVELQAFVGGDTTAVWDYRDIPVTAVITAYDREEDQATPGGLVISPSPSPDTTLLRNEVNVIEWGPSSVAPVFSSDYNISIDPSVSGISAPFGWANLVVNSKVTVTQAVCDLILFTATGGFSDPVNPNAIACTDVVNTKPPMIGFAAWQRTFDDANKNYGRIVEHSYVTS